MSFNTVHVSLVLYLCLISRSVWYCFSRHLGIDVSLFLYLLYLCSVSNELFLRKFKWRFFYKHFLFLDPLVTLWILIYRKAIIIIKLMDISSCVHIPAFLSSNFCLNNAKDESSFLFKYKKIFLSLCFLAL